MFLIDKTKELTPVYLGKVIQEYTTNELLALQKYRNYYNGKQKILERKPSDTGKPCNKVVCNYCYTITQNYLGYIAGIPVNYENENFDKVIDVLRYNDYATEDNELLRNALIYGRAFEIVYIDEEGNQRFKVLNTEECIPIYENTLTNDLLYVVRFYREDLLDKQNENYIVEVYGPDKIVKYQSTAGFTSFMKIYEKPHFYKQCPVTVFSLNTDEKSIFDKVIGLQDGYNSLLSDEVDDFDSFADAYLVLKGAMAEDEELEDMKKNRVLIMDPDASADYLTKSINDTQISNMLQNFNDQIYKVSNSPDFTDEKFLSQSGVAIKYKLIGFENIASSIESNMRKALQRRIELLSTIMNISTDEQVWRDVEITFTRNLPTDLSDTVNVVNQLRGLVSNRTLLTLLPFIKNVDEELKAVEEENQKKMELYSFTNFNSNEEEESEDE